MGWKHWGLKGLAMTAALGAAFAMVACNGGGGAEADNKKVEVLVFKGGYGSDFYEAAAEEFNKATGKEVEVIGDPRIDQQVQPRMQKGDPPDLMYPGWRFDHWKAVDDGAIMDLTETMKSKPASGEGTWGDTFEPALLKLGQYEGKQYVLPYFFSVIGWWYDPDLFAEKGWAPPKTYAEMLNLCQKIKAAGIAPITYQGQYPDYMISGMLTPWMISSGGLEAFNACQNLEPGAWKNPAVIKAATMIKELSDMGYFQQGATAMSHTESQAEFVNRRAAMIPCGTWLNSEMKESMPEGRKMSFFLPPVIGDGAGDPTAVMIKIEPWMVPAEAKNKEAAIDYFKSMTTVEKAKQFVTEKGTLMAIKGANDVELPGYLQGAADAFKNSNATYAPLWREWYPTLYKAVEGAITELLNGQLTPEAFGEKIEAEAEKIRNNPDIPKRKVS
ncbi:MAG: extracellular solute-binding protein [Armatimonadetes bacterium]|nr:extracellular solute-binding protein [Armatimonadota bacterium]